LSTLQGAAIGDVFVSTGKMHHDRRIPLPGFDKQGLGYVESTPTPQLQAALGLKAGIVTSGNSLDYTGKQNGYAGYMFNQRFRQSYDVCTVRVL
jgi:hypothetical protein